jgi:hypothetical protein
VAIGLHSPLVGTPEAEELHKSLERADLVPIDSGPKPQLGPQLGEWLRLQDLFHRDTPPDLIGQITSGIGRRPFRNRSACLDSA